MTVSRGHHFVPQCYLRNFADPLKGQLLVFDREGKRFPTSTRNVAKKRDFNTVRGASPPDIVEQYYAEIEDKVAIALIEVRQTGELTQDRLDLIIALIAILHVRSPRKRSLSGGFMTDVARHIMSLTLKDEKTYAATLTQMRAAGHDVADTIGFEAMKQFVASEQYEITTATKAHIDIELDLLPVIETVLKQRNWCLMVAPQGSEFVSCDHPSNLFGTAYTGSAPLGLGLSHTEVFLPICPEYALAGRYEEQPLEAHVDFLTVAERNAGTIYSCSRQVYARSDKFLYKRPSALLMDMKVGGDLIADTNFLRKADSRA